MSPTRFRRLPPISALCAIEAVARLGSVTKAAAEIGLTQSAVSHNIRLVEETLGVTLFRREASGTEVLARGETLASAIQEGLGRIADAVAAIRRNDSGPSLTVSVLPGFAVKWLFPRLIRFDGINPNIELSIMTTANLVDFDAGETTVALRYGTGEYPGLHVERLFGEEMFPVCAPAYAASGAKPLSEPADLERHVLLHDEIWPLRPTVPGWRSWLDLAGYPQISAERGRHFSQSNISLQAAIAGLGVALGRSPLVLDDLAEGRLVRPFGPAMPTGYAYYFVCPPRALEIEKIRIFREWLMAEAAATRAALGLAEDRQCAPEALQPERAAKTASRRVAARRRA